LSGLGDCVSVAGDGAGLWTVHVHCNDIGAAIEVGVETGRPHRITVARFADEPVAAAARFDSDRAVVVAARGEGLAELVRAEGALVLVVDDETDAYALLQVISATAAAQVTVLPAGADLTELADEAAIRAVAGGQDVVVVPCASPVQALAALAVHDVRRTAGDDVVGMAEAAAATRRGDVTVATEDAMSWVGRVAAGDVLGFTDGEVVLIEPGPADAEAVIRASCAVVDRMLAAGGELVTVLVGSGAPSGLADELDDFLRRERPEAELAVYAGGQPDSLVAIGIE
jgi:dihydroxyacetone kinase-like predicted kinase